MKKFTLFLTLAVAMANVPVAAMQTVKNAAYIIVDELTDGAFIKQAKPAVVAPQVEQQASASVQAEDGSNRAGAAELAEFDKIVADNEQSLARKARMLNAATVAAKGAKTCGKVTVATAALAAAGAATVAGLAYWYAPAETCAKAAEICATSGNMVCQKAIDTCAPYLVPAVQPTWTEATLALLRQVGLAFGC